MIAGPSEILIIADKTADPKFLAADLMSQAEHDKLASSILLTDSEALAEQTKEATEKITSVLEGLSQEADEVVNKADKSVEIAGSQKDAANEATEQFGAICDGVSKLDDEAREMLRFLNENPEYKVLLSSSRKLKPEDLDIIKAMIERMS